MTDTSGIKHGSAFKDLTGKVFGRLTVLHFSRSTGRSHSRWLCRCECGNEKIILGNSIVSGRTVSCGCFLKQRIHETRFKHGSVKVREYRIWWNMKMRVGNPKHAQFKDYGGRGIRICDRWFDSFENFLKDMGPCPPGSSIDRINNDGNYEPGNCRWATKTEQNNNSRRNHYLTHNGVTQTIAQWAKAIGMQRSCLSNRLRTGWSVEDAITTPLRIA